MVKITFLGSCRFSPYEILAVPDPIPGAWNTNEGYVIAFKVFKPAIENADIVIVHNPDGIGEHTGRDLDYAKSLGKHIIYTHSLRKPRMNKGIWNHVNNSYIWYHTTPPERLESILKNGLKVNSSPTCQNSPEPWIYVSTEPFWMKDGVLLEVDLEETKHEDAGWPFQSGPEEDPEEWEARWQLRVLVDITSEKITASQFKEKGGQC